MLTLYFAPGSSSMAPHIALHEIGAPFEAKPLSFRKQETRGAAFLAINPQGTVPVLLVDGRPMSEVAAILFYLAKRFPEAGLLPEGDIEAQAQAVSWMSFIASALHPARQRGGDYAVQIWGVANEKLAERDWAVGAYSIADIHLFRLYWRIVGTRGLGPETYPNLHRHYEAMMARPAVRRTIEIESAIGYELPGMGAPERGSASV
jgi:glutathione S-transferase